MRYDCRTDTYTDGKNRVTGMQLADKQFKQWRRRAIWNDIKSCNLKLIGQLIWNLLKGLK